MPDAHLCDICELKRLQILENAAIHYGSGIVSLERRALDDIYNINNSHPEVAQTLVDIARYLHDIIEVAGLRVSDCNSDELHFNNSTKLLVGGG